MYAIMNLTQLKQLLRYMQMLMVCAEAVDWFERPLWMLDLQGDMDSIAWEIKRREINAGLDETQEMPVS